MQFDETLYREAMGEGGYANYTVYVNAAAKGGNGTREAPFSDYAAAFAIAKKLLGHVPQPATVSLCAAEGHYPISETLTLSGLEMPKGDIRLVLAGAGKEKTVLSSLHSLPTDGFEKVGGNLWRYRFPAKEKPDFRYLYVNGKWNNLAHTENSSDSGALRHFRRMRTADIVYDIASALMKEGKLAETSAKEALKDYPLLSARPSVLRRFERYRDLLPDAEVAFADLKALKSEGKLTQETQAKPGVSPAYWEAFYNLKPKLLRGWGTWYLSTEALSDTVKKCRVYCDLADLEPFRPLVEERRKKAVADGTYDEETFPYTCLSGLQLELHNAMMFSCNIMHVRGVDFDEVYPCAGIGGKVENVVAVYLDPKEYNRFNDGNGTPMRDRPYFLANEKRLMRKEGDCFYDRKTGEVYLYSEKETLKDYSLSYPSLSYLVHMEDVHDVTFRDMAFTGTDDLPLSNDGINHTQFSTDPREGSTSRGAVLIEKGSEGVAVVRCAFRDLPTSAFTVFDWTDNLRVTDSVFENLGGNGLRLGKYQNGWTKGLLGCANVYIYNNLFRYAAQVYRNACFIITCAAKDMKILYNTLHHCSYSAISLSYSWGKKDWKRGEGINLYGVEVAYNYISGFCSELYDGGAIYNVGGSYDRDTFEGYVNSLHHNYIVYDRYTGDKTGAAPIGALYNDNDSTHWHDYSNVVVKHSDAVRKAHPVHEGLVWPQAIPTVPAYHILFEDNWYLNIQSSDGAEQRREAYGVNKLSEERHIYEKNTHYIRGIAEIPASLRSFIATTGCDGAKADPTALDGNDY